MLNWINAHIKQPEVVVFIVVVVILAVATLFVGVEIAGPRPLPVMQYFYASGHTYHREGCKLLGQHVVRLTLNELRTFDEIEPCEVCKP